MERHLVRSIAAAGVVLGLGLGPLVSGCSSDDGASTEATTTGATASTTRNAGSAGSGEGAGTQQLLTDLALAPSDVRSDELLRPALDADVLSPAGGLEHCGLHLRSDARRVGRHQADLLLDGRPLVTSEAIRYEPGVGATAMDEFRAAVAQCPQGEYRDDGLGAVPTSTTSEPIPADRLTGVAPDHVALFVTEEVQGGDGADVRQVVVVQRRGDVVVATSGYGEEARILEIAAAVGGRLAAADPDTIGA